MAGVNSGFMAAHHFCYSTAHMRAAAIFGPGCSPKKLRPFQIDASIDWRIGMPSAADQADIILLFGGDGTIHRNLSQLVTLSLPVLVVPAGSGNDFARALELRSVRDSIAAWHRFCRGEGSVRAIDLGVIAPLNCAAGSTMQSGETRDSALHAQHYFSSVAGVGLDAEVSRRANSLPRWLRGHGGYALALPPALFGVAPSSIKISTCEEGAKCAATNQPSWQLSRTLQPMAEG